MDKSSTSTFNDHFNELCGILGLEKLFQDFGNFHPTNNEKLFGVLAAALWDWHFRASKKGRTGEETGCNLGIPDGSNG